MLVKTTYHLYENQVVKSLLDDIRLHKIPLEGIEQETPYGRVDILTQRSLVEVKEFKYYKEGIGQLVSYNSYFQKRSMILAVFNRNFPKRFPDTSLLFDLCQSRGIYLYKFHPERDFGEFLKKYKIEYPTKNPFLR